MEGPNQLLLRETINLDHTTVVLGSVVEKLAPHQLEGIRIIHRGLAQKNGFILNDESGLGKTHQVIGYLSAVSASADKSAIICSSLQRIHHWIYHIELLTKLDYTVSGENGDHENHQIILTTSENFHHLSKQVAIKLLVIDETKGNKFDTALLRTITSFTTAKKLFVLSTNLLDDISEFSVRLKICRVQYFAEALRDFLDQILLSKRSPKKAQKLKLFFLTRSVYIRRFKSNYKTALPLVEKSLFNSHFEAWRLSKEFEVEPEVETTQTAAVLIMNTSETKKPVPEPFDGEELVTEAEENASLNRALIAEDDNDADAAAGTLVQKESEPLFDFEASTEDMPHLVVESSDSESKMSSNTVPEMAQVLRFIPDAPSRSPTTNIEVPETESSSQKTEYQTDSEGYLEFGQALGCCNSESEISADTVIVKADQQPSILEEKYNFPIDRFLRRKSSSSSEAQILSKESVTCRGLLAVVVESSSSSNGAAREKSPDLFTDTEDELDETAKNDSIDDTLTKLLMKSPVELDKTVPKPASKFPKSNVSTPISKLIHAQLQATVGSSTVDASSEDIFADVTVRKAAETTDVFEITDNAAFGNQIKVVGACVSPLQQDSESDVQFVDVVRQPDGPIEIVDLDSEVCTPKSQTGRNVQKTPSTTGSAGSTPRGWLTKSSRNSSDGGSPRTPTNSKRSVKCRRSDHGSGSGFKRKKLDNWFQDDDDDRGADGKRASTSANKRKSTTGGSGGSRKVSPRKKCFQERVLQRINQILVSPTGFDSDFD